jgi:hypothetical protein
MIYIHQQGVCEGGLAGSSRIRSIAAFCCAVNSPIYRVGVYTNTKLTSFSLSGFSFMSVDPLALRGGEGRRSDCPVVIGWCDGSLVDDKGLELVGTADEAMASSVF